MEKVKKIEADIFKFEQQTNQGEIVDISQIKGLRSTIQDLNSKGHISSPEILNSRLDSLEEAQQTVVEEEHYKKYERSLRK